MGYKSFWGLGRYKTDAYHEISSTPFWRHCHSIKRLGLLSLILGGYTDIPRRYAHAAMHRPTRKTRISKICRYLIKFEWQILRGLLFWTTLYTLWTEEFRISMFIPFVYCYFLVFTWALNAQTKIPFMIHSAQCKSITANTWLKEYRPNCNDFLSRLNARLSLHVYI